MKGKMSLMPETIKSLAIEKQHTVPDSSPFKRSVDEEETQQSRNLLHDDS